MLSIIGKRVKKQKDVTHINLTSSLKDVTLIKLPSQCITRLRLQLVLAVKIDKNDGWLQSKLSE